MSILPHLAEVVLILVVVAVIFGVGRWPVLSERIARSTLPPSSQDE